MVSLAPATATVDRPGDRRRLRHHAGPSAQGEPRRESPRVQRIGHLRVGRRGALAERCGPPRLLAFEAARPPDARARRLRSSRDSPASAQHHHRRIHRRTGARARSPGRHPAGLLQRDGFHRPLSGRNHWGIENDFVLLVHETLRKTAAPVLGHYQWGFRDSILGFAEFGVFPLCEGGKSVARCIDLDDFLPFESQIGNRR